MMRAARLVVAWLAGLFVLCALAAPARAAEGARFALLVQGASGEEQYAILHRRWLDSLATVLADRFKYDAAHLIVLSEQPRRGS
jgi:hypothetical protein